MIANSFFPIGEYGVLALLAHECALFPVGRDALQS
jgi:hypothetical protein